MYKHQIYQFSDCQTNKSPIKITPNMRIEKQIFNLGVLTKISTENKKKLSQKQAKLPIVA